MTACTFTSNTSGLEPALLWRCVLRNLATLSRVMMAGSSYTRLSILSTTWIQIDDNIYIIYSNIYFIYCTDLNG